MIFTKTVDSVSRRVEIIALWWAFYKTVATQTRFDRSGACSRNPPRPQQGSSSDSILYSIVAGYGQKRGRDVQVPREREI
jgi:hypothetical protein